MAAMPKPARASKTKDDGSGTALVLPLLAMRRFSNVCSLELLKLEPLLPGMLLIEAKSVSLTLYVLS